MKPPIAGITRVRNEGKIIGATLDHYAEFCDAGIYVLDEASTDDTRELCRKHPAVGGIIDVIDFEPRPMERRRFEGWGRELPFRLACAMVNDPALWVVCFDADERLYWDVDSFDFDFHSAAQFRLWDFYITPDDDFLPAHRHTDRQYIGPEYREIVMAAKASAINGWHNRPPTFHDTLAHALHPDAGDVKHYGKAISVEEFNRTVDYYTRYQPEAFRKKWEARRGKAVKIDYKSDFGADLCTWGQRREIGYPLVDNLV